MKNTLLLEQALEAVGADLEKLKESGALQQDDTAKLLASLGDAVLVLGSELRQRTAYGTELGAVYAEQVREATNFLKAQNIELPKVLFIAGSGLRDAADDVEDARVFAQADIPGYPASTVEGHGKEVVFGRYADVPVMILKGRSHPYETARPRLSAFPVFLAGMLGATGVIVTNASGSTNPEFGPKELVLIENHLNDDFLDPFYGMYAEELSKEGMFQPLAYPYDLDLLSKAYEIISAHKDIPVRRGVYWFHAGPAFDTAAEVERARRAGADVIGMSTLSEVIAARRLDMKVLGISGVTNYGAGVKPDLPDPSHEETLERSAINGQKVNSILPELIKLMVSN